MIKMLELREIIKLVHQSSIDECELIDGGIRISLKKDSPVVSISTASQASVSHAKAAMHEVATASAGSVDEAPFHSIVSSVIGVFTSSPEPGADPYVKVGDKITPGTVLCSCNVEALNLFHQIRSEVNGKIVQILVQDGAFIEYGQPLFLVQLEQGEIANV
jgi:acetyl-CoA carboxylase biotin carboxyl carrier protein